MKRTLPASDWARLCRDSNLSFERLVTLPLDQDGRNKSKEKNPKASPELDSLNNECTKYSQNNTAQQSYKISLKREKLLCINILMCNSTDNLFFFAFTFLGGSYIFICICVTPCF